MKSVKTILKEIEKEEKKAKVYGGQSTINLAYWVPILRKALEKAEVEHQRIINKVNKVTSYRRHNHPIPTSAMVELCNRQIEVEEVWQEIESELNGAYNES